MTEKELIANLLRGAERNRDEVKASCDEVAEIIDNLVKGFQKRGYENKISVFLAVKTFETLVENVTKNEKR